MNPCGQLSIPDAVQSIAVGDLLFSFSSILVHILEAFDLDTKNISSSRIEDHSSVLGIRYDINYTKEATQVICWIYLGINVTNILLAILIWQAVIKNCVLKCMSYLVISPFVITIGLSTLLFHAIFLGKYPHYYALGMYPMYYIIFKPYSLWVVNRFLRELRDSPIKKHRRRLNGYESIDDCDSGSGHDGRKGAKFGNNFREYYRHSEGDLLELKLPTKFEISEDKLQLDHKTCLEYEDLFAVIRGLLTIDQDTPKSSKISGNFMEVAVKTLKVTTPTIPYGNRLLQEAKLLVHIGSHDHILKFYGMCTKMQPKEKMFLVMEYYPRGKLDTFLRDCVDSYGGKTFKNLLNDQGMIEVPSEKIIYENLPISKLEFTTIDMINWAYQIASAVEHLHTKRVIFGNLQAKSIALINTKLVKLTGFTFSAKLFSCSQTLQREDLPSRFPWRWTALECIEATDKIRFSTRSDVWSYAIVLWEIFSLGEVPYGLWESDIVRNLISGVRLEKPKYAPNQIFQIMEACWRRDPGDRPNFSLLKLFFQQVLSSLTKSSTY